MSPISSATPTNSRSNQVRQRRTQQAQARIEHVHKRVQSPVKNQPVVTRGASSTRGARPVHQSARGNVRRQYYYNLDASGVEVRLPAVPMINPGWRLVSGMLAVAMLIGIFLLTSGSAFEVSSLQITGLQRLSPADVETALKLNGTSALDVDPAEVTAQVNALFPELADVKVSLGLPARVAISARERQPVVAWQMPDRTVWVDPEGVLIPARGEAAILVTLQADGLPALIVPEAVETDEAVADTPAARPAVFATGEGSRMDLNLLSAALKLSTQVPEGSPLAFSTANGLGWSDARGWKVFIGNDLTNLETKVSEYETIVQQLSERGITPVVISVEYTSAPFFRTE
ncbi:MAG: FtsQ-type POTRA domain-containing protein [Chloroflexi bacterium]|nr:FtsQ-type POTRA domain-containing protein [Chloroflexota bacterium]